MEIKWVGRDGYRDKSVRGIKKRQSGKDGFFWSVLTESVFFIILHITHCVI